MIEYLIKLIGKVIYGDLNDELYTEPEIDDIITLDKSGKRILTRYIDNGQSMFIEDRDQGDNIFRFINFTEVDNDGRIIHFRDRNNFEYWKEYNKYGDLVKYQSNDGYSSENVYDEFHNIIYHTDSFGNSDWRTYNSYNLITSYRNNHGVNEKYAYLIENGKLFQMNVNTYEKKAVALADASSCIIDTVMDTFSKYDSSGRIIYRIHGGTRKEEWFTYDNNGEIECHRISLPQ